jgi:hypothetical protein
VVSSDKVNDVAAIQRPAMTAGRAQNLRVSTGAAPFGSDATSWRVRGRDGYVALRAGKAKGTRSAS